MAMDNWIKMLPVLLWIPFLLVVLIVGLIFCIRGYKKGVLKGVIALGATVVAAGISLLVAPLLSSLLAKPVFPAVNTALEETLASMDSLARAVVNSFLEDLVVLLVAMLLFPLLFILLSVGARIAASRLTRDKFTPTHKGHHWGGLGVGVADTLIYALVLLLPLYGTIGSLAPAVGGLLDAENGAVIQGLSTHPLVWISGIGPFGFAYETITDVPGGDLSNGESSDGESSNEESSDSDTSDDTSIDPIEAIRDISEIFTQVKNILEKDPSQYGDIDLQQVQDLRDRVTDGDWFYPIAKVFYEEMQTTGEIENISHDETLTFTRPEVEAAGKQLADYFVAEMEAQIKGDGQAVEKMDAPATIGAIFNSSPSAVSFKYVLFNYSIHKMVGEHEEGKVFQQELMKMMSAEPLTDPAEIKTEGELIMLMFKEVFDTPDTSALLYAMAEHPQAEEETINRILNVFAAE